MSGGFIIGGIAVGFICGFITDKINTSKGYDGGFAWGFFLGIIGIIIVAVRTDSPNITNKTEISNIKESYDEHKFVVCQNCNERNPEGSIFCCSCGANLEGRWKCECGAENGKDSKFCSQCGKKKEEKTIVQNDKADGETNKDVIDSDILQKNRETKEARDIFILCPYCKMEQRADRNICYNCGRNLRQK